MSHLTLLLALLLFHEPRILPDDVGGFAGKAKSIQCAGAILGNQPEVWLNLVCQAGIVDFRRSSQVVSLFVEFRYIPGAHGDEQPWAFAYARLPGL